MLGAVPRLPMTLLAAALGACAPTLELGVDLRTDLAPGLDFEVVTVELREGADGAAPTIREAIARLPAGTDGLDVGARVATFEGLAPGAYRVRVELAGMPPRRGDVALELDASRAVTVAITSACDGVVCPAGQGCVNGGCVEPACLDAAGDVDCGDPRCAGAACDDGDLCTHGDACAGGACVGNAIVCEDDDCTTRRCDGTAACAETALAEGAPCASDDNACTTDACDGAGTCVHAVVPDGTPWDGGDFAACCGGREARLDERTDCGGCGVACAGTRPCNVIQFEGFAAHPACECEQADPACPGPQICNGFLNFCFCTMDEHCPAGTTCQMMPLPPSTNTHNYCG